MRTQEVAVLFRVDVTTVRRWSREGRLKPRRTPGGRQLRFLRSEVEALLADQTPAVETPEEVS